MSFGYKGSVKLGYDTVSRINIATPLNLLQEKVLENRGLFKHSKECDKIGNCHIPFSIGGIETE